MEKTNDVHVKNLITLRKKSYNVKFDLTGSEYDALDIIGSGAYGVVCSAIHQKTKNKVAIKKIPAIFDNHEIAKRTYREIRILKHFKHDNIIGIREILKPNEANFCDIYIVFDFMESDLHQIIHSKQEITEEHVRLFLYYILRGLKYIHSANVIHRDLKPSNLLVDQDCNLKIGDFGMARGMSSRPDQQNILLTTYVATRWYRAPELLLPFLEYSAAVDMWSVGCIFAEMLSRKQIFPGKNPRDQLECIVRLLGRPSNECLSKIPNSEGFISRNIELIQSWNKYKPIPLRNVYPNASKKAVDLLSKMLIFDPHERISVDQAIKHPFLNKHHEPNDEPICIPVFNFDFEQKDFKGDKVKAAITKEIMDFHKPKPTFDLASFNLKPVPKEDVFKPVLLSTVKAKPPTQPSGQNTGLAAFLQQRASNGQNKTQSSDNTFLRPADVKPVVVDTTKSSDDIEMLSASSTKSNRAEKAEEEPAGTNSDVDMPSAKCQTPAVEKFEQEAKKPLDTKALIKEAILKAGLRKQQMALENKPPKPITAYQKQKQREEKRQEKLTRAKERKKKKVPTATLR